MNFDEWYKSIQQTRFTVYIDSTNASNSGKIKRNWMKCEIKGKENTVCAQCSQVFQEGRCWNAVPAISKTERALMNDPKTSLQIIDSVCRSMDRHEFLVSGPKSISKRIFIPDEHEMYILGEPFECVWTVKCKCYLYCHPGASGLILVFMIAHKRFYSSIRCHTAYVFAWLRKYWQRRKRTVDTITANHFWYLHAKCLCVCAICRENSTKV